MSGATFYRWECSSNKKKCTFFFDVYLQLGNANTFVCLMVVLGVLSWNCKFIFSSFVEVQNSNFGL